MGPLNEFLRFLAHQHWLPLGLRLRVVRFFRHPDRTPSTPFTTDFFGFAYRGNLNILLDSHVYFFGAYALQELKLLQSLVTFRGPGAVFVDIGANVGQHSVFMSRHAAQVHSFEPWSVVSKQIEQKIEENKITNICVHPVGLSDRSEQLEFYASETGNSGTGSFSSQHAPDRNKSMGKLDVRSGDEYFQQAGIQKVDVMKIDAEGWEKNVLSGLKRIIASCRPIIFTEYSTTTAGSMTEGRKELMRLLPDDYVARKAEFTDHGFNIREMDESEEASDLVLLSSREAEEIVAFRGPVD